jgi:hypothetical protein
MSLLHLHKPAKRATVLTQYERNAVIKRVAQIAVAIGHPQRSAEQIAALLRERASLESTLAADDSMQGQTRPALCADDRQRKLSE